MKTFLLLPLVAFSLFASPEESKDELSWVNKQVEAIKPKRDGIHTQLLSRLNDPFIFLDKNKTEKKEKEKEKTQRALIPSSKQALTNTQSVDKVEKPSYKALTLDAVINQSVLINGNWYKLNDTVRGYTIKSINLTSATLIKNKSELILTTKTENSTLKFKNK
jgi:hypothetical protein